MSRRVKAEKVARASQRSAPEDASMVDSRDEEEDDEAAQLERVLATIANYPDQPIDEQQEAKLRVISSEINVFNNLYSTALDDILETATMLADALPGDDHPLENQEMIRLKDSLLTLLDNQHAAELHLDTITDDIRKPVAAGRKIVDPASILDTGFEKRIEMYRSQTARQKYSKSKPLKNFITNVWESHRPDESAPTVNTILPREEGDPEDSDDEMEVGGVTQDYKCPLTLQIYDDPLTSTACGHSFSADAIRAYVRTNNRCPAQGCNAQISLGVLKEDKVLQKKARAAKRRAAREESESAEEIDD
ncbi:E3 SUMO-protein ligase nse2 [Rhizoctonia solani]|uniref:E3 SUMO-protein ligase nse2 n=1 Tax=Rhizoctonia solani TaxID=456999 RepID=A0A0K6GAR6_9AGAM|nr:E3 SUMO-protein ligase nse2 [Rhizoctonia solani]